MQGEHARSDSEGQTPPQGWLWGEPPLNPSLNTSDKPLQAAQHISSALFVCLINFTQTNLSQGREHKLVPEGLKTKFALLLCLFWSLPVFIYKNYLGSSFWFFCLDAVSVSLNSLNCQENSVPWNWEKPQIPNAPLKKKWVLKIRDWSDKLLLWACWSNLRDSWHIILGGCQALGLVPSKFQPPFSSN